MSWSFRSAIQASRDWQYSPLISSPIIQIRSDTPAGTPYKGLIGKARLGALGYEFREIQGLWALPETRIIQFENDLVDFGGYFLAFKGTRGRNIFRWSIQISEWDTPITQVEINPGELIPAEGEIVP